MKSFLHWSIAIIVAGLFIGFMAGGGQGSPDTEQSPAAGIEIYGKTSKPNWKDGVDITCTLANNTGRTVRTVNVGAKFYDAAGVVVGDGFGTARHLAPGEKHVVQVSSMDIYNSTRYELAVTYVSYAD